jgi:hypothetical protein
VLLALLAVLPTVCVPGSLVLDACRVQRELRLLTEDLVALTTFKDLDDDIDLEWSAAPGQRPARGGAPTPQGHEP